MTVALLILVIVGTLLAGCLAVFTVLCAVERWMDIQERREFNAADAGDEAGSPFGMAEPDEPADWWKRS